MLRSLGGPGSGLTGHTTAPETKAERAFRTQKVADKEKQDAGEANEEAVAKLIAGAPLLDNEPMDVIVKDASGVHGVEVKTLLDNANDKITVRRAALERKVHWARSEHAKLHTVVIDDRDTFKGGAYKEQYSGAKMYYRRGSGSFRLKSMTVVRDAEHLTALMRGRA